MATIKVFDCEGVKELNCFDTLANVPYLPVEESSESDQEEDDTVGF